MADNDAPPLETPQEQPGTTPTPPPETPAADSLHERVEGISKSLQSVTQILSHLQKKVEGGGELNAVERAKLEMANIEALKLRKEIDDYAGATDVGEDNGFTHKVTKVISNLNKRVDTMEAENQSLKKQIASAQPSADEQWAIQEEKYPGVNVKKVWKEAMKAAENTKPVKAAQALLDAGAITQEAFDAILQGAAQDPYHAKATASKPAELPVASPPPPNSPPVRKSAHMPGVQPAAEITHNDVTAQRALERLSY